MPLMSYDPNQYAFMSTNKGPVATNLQTKQQTPVTYPQAGVGTQTPQPQTPQPQAPQAPSGGGGTGYDQVLRDMKEGRRVWDDNVLASLQQSQPEAPTIDYDAMIRPVLENLDKSIGDFQSANQAIEGGITGWQGAQTAATKQSFGEQEQTLGRTKTETQARAEGAVKEQQKLKESASDQARRQTAELMQGIQSRFGGSSGTGVALSEIMGAQGTRNLANIQTTAMKQVADIRQNLGFAMQEISDKLGQIQEMGRVALQDIDSKAEQQMASAKHQLAQDLSAIRAQKTELQSKKLELVQRSMENYQQAVQQVNANNTAFKQQLFQQQAVAEQELKMAMQKAQNTAKSIPNMQFKTVSLTGGGQQAYTFNPSTGKTEPVTAGAPGGITANDPVQKLISSGQAKDEDEARMLLGQ